MLRRLRMFLKQRVIGMAPVSRKGTAKLRSMT